MMDVELTPVALSVFDRLALPNAIPLGVPPGFNLVTGKIVMDLGADLGFSEAEVAERNIKYGDNGQISWTTGEPKTVEFGPIALGIVRTGLKAAALQWSAQDALTMNHMILLKKFDVDVDALIAELADKEVSDDDDEDEPTIAEAA